MSSQIQNLLKTLVQNDAAPAPSVSTDESSFKVNYMGKGKTFDLAMAKSWAKSGYTFKQVLEDAIPGNVNTSRVTGVQLLVDGVNRSSGLTLQTTLPDLINEAQSSVVISYQAASGKNG